jgi:hypothetical protein
MTTVNQSIWLEYVPGFTDSLFYPYINRANNGIVDPRRIPVDKNGMSTVASPPEDCKSCQQIGDPNMVNQNLIRQGYNQTFQLKHSNFPCPTGWSKVDTPSGKPASVNDVALRYCVRNNPEFEGTMYTEKMPQRFHLNQSRLEEKLQFQDYQTPRQGKGVNPNISKYWDDGNENFRRQTNVYKKPQGLNTFADQSQKYSYLAS